MASATYDQYAIMSGLILSWVAGADFYSLSPMKIVGVFHQKRSCHSSWVVLASLKLFLTRFWRFLNLKLFCPSQWLSKCRGARFVVWNEKSFAGFRRKLRFRSRISFAGWTGSIWRLEPAWSPNHRCDLNNKKKFQVKAAQELRGWVEEGLLVEIVYFVLDDGPAHVDVGGLRWREQRGREHWRREIWVLRRCRWQLKLIVAGAHVKVARHGVWVQRLFICRHIDDLIQEWGIDKQYVANNNIAVAIRIRIRVRIRIRFRVRIRIRFRVLFGYGSGYVFGYRYEYVFGYVCGYK